MAPCYYMFYCHCMSETGYFTTLWTLENITTLKISEMYSRLVKCSAFICSEHFTHIVAIKSIAYFTFNRSRMFSRQFQYRFINWVNESFTRIFVRSVSNFSKDLFQICHTCQTFQLCQAIGHIIYCFRPTTIVLLNYLRSYISIISIFSFLSSVAFNIIIKF